MPFPESDGLDFREVPFASVLDKLFKTDDFSRLVDSFMAERDSEHIRIDRESLKNNPRALGEFIQYLRMLSEEKPAFAKTVDFNRIIRILNDARIELLLTVNSNESTVVDELVDETQVKVFNPPSERGFPEFDEEILASLDEE